MSDSFNRQRVLSALLFLVVVAAGAVTGWQIKLIALANMPVPADAQTQPETIMWQMLYVVIPLVILTIIFRVGDLPVLAVFTSTAAIPSGLSLANNALIVFFSGLPDEVKTFFMTHLM